jgi:hypothetical protein
MKNEKFIKRVASVTGLLLGAFVLSAVAGTWTAPASTPPNGNVDAPLNVGIDTQTKNGTIYLKGLAVNPTGTANITVGSVLTATNADGTVGWTSPNTSGSGSIPSNLTIFTTSGTWTAPAGVTRVRVRVWGGGGGGGSYWGTGPLPGGGGGGGGYAEAIVPVTAGTAYAVAVGSGGAGGVNATGESADRCGTDGGTSSFGGTLLIAYGGKRGHSACGDGEGQNGGYGGSYSIGSGVSGFGIQGGDGQKGGSSTGQTEGGTSPMGGQGSSAWKESGANTPGGGGGGGVSSPSAYKIGFSGAKGKVIIEY